MANSPNLEGIVGGAKKAILNGSLIALMGASYFLTACNPPTPTATPTGTKTPAATYTPTSNTLEGRLFFDMNGSGVPDEATFNYDSSRLTDALQPLQPDLQKEIVVYVGAHPDIKDGDLITIEEPGLSGYTVCASDKCATTDANGAFVIPGADKTSYIKITDPNAGTPALEMRYINQWKGPVTVPEYTKDVDAATMAKLTLVPACDADASAMVCKQDADTLLVREQHLNDTEVLPIYKSLTVQTGKANEIGLMQGFLTLPFVSEQVKKPFIWNYFDILGKRIIDDQHTYASTQDSVMLTYDGKYHAMASESQIAAGKQIAGVGDSHTGLDYLIPVGNLIVSGAPTSEVWYLAGPTELRVNLMFQDPNNSNSNFDNCYGHLDVQLVNKNQTIYRGQIVGISGNTGDPSPYPPTSQLHFHVAKALEGNAWYYLDPYRYTVKLDPLPANFWGSEDSLWSSDNNPQFPILSSGNK